MLRDYPKRRTLAIQEINLKDYPNNSPKFEAKG